MNSDADPATASCGAGTTAGSLDGRRVELTLRSVSESHGFLCHPDVDGDIFFFHADDAEADCFVPGDVVSAVLQYRGGKYRATDAQYCPTPTIHPLPITPDPWTIWLALRGAFSRLAQGEITPRSCRDALARLRQRGTDISECLMEWRPTGSHNLLQSFRDVTDRLGSARLGAARERLAALRQRLGVGASLEAIAMLEYLDRAIAFRSPSEVAVRPTEATEASAPAPRPGPTGQPAAQREAPTPIPLFVGGLSRTATLQNVLDLLLPLDPAAKVHLHPVPPTAGAPRSAKVVVSADRAAEVARRLDGMELDGWQLRVRPWLATGQASRPAGRGAKAQATTHVRTATDRTALQSLSATSRSLRSASGFAVDATCLTIYVDEGWPQSAGGSAHSRIGVIAGIVWIGDRPDPGILPLIRTHLDPMTERPVCLQRLLQCSRALPFLMPISAAGQVAQNEYPELLRTAVAVLLGWVLPQEGSKCRVRILAERIQGSEEGTQRTEYFRGLIAGLKGSQTAGRFARWDVEEVRWTGKNDEYVPYGDLVAYLGASAEGGQVLAEAARVHEWPGYVQLSTRLLPRLVELDAAEATGFAEALIALVREQRGTRLCQMVVDGAVRRAQDNPGLATAVVAALERAYEQKERNLDELRAVSRPFLEGLPAPAEKAHPRLQLLRSVLELQDANHHGDPERAYAAAACYEARRDRLAPHDRELCAYADLNLAVHYNDRFESEVAQLISAGVVESPGFDYLSPVMRGRAMSSLGQAYAIAGMASEADAWFGEALRTFTESGLPERDVQTEVSQTGVYRAINALDGELPTALQLVESVGGPLSDAARQLAAIHERKYDYQHHLFLRSLWAMPDKREATAAYLAKRSRWHHDQQHPWELIALYRGLLLWRTEGGAETDEASVFWFRQGIEVATAPHHGAVLRLIGATIATVAACCHEGDDFGATAHGLLDGIGKCIPGADAALTSLRAVLDRGPQPEAISEALGSLPFNYR